MYSSYSTLLSYFKCYSVHKMRKNQTKDIAGSDKTNIKYKSARAQRVTYRVHVNRCSEIPPDQT